MSDNTQEEKLSPIYDSVVDMVLMGITGNNTLEFSPDGEGYNAPTLRASNGIVRIYDGVRTYIPPVAQVTLDTITGIALDSGEPLTWSGETISSGWGYVPIENPILRALLKATHPSAAIYDVTAGMITLLIPAPTPHPNKVIRVVVIDSSNPKNYQPQSDFRGGYQGPSNNRGYQTQSHSRELPVRSSNTQYHRSTAFIDRVPTNPYLQYSSAYGKTPDSLKFAPWVELCAPLTLQYIYSAIQDFLYGREHDTTLLTQYLPPKDLGKLGVIKQTLYPLPGDMVESILEVALSMKTISIPIYAHINHIPGTNHDVLESLRVVTSRIKQRISQALADLDPRNYKGTTNISVTLDPTNPNHQYTLDRLHIAFPKDLVELEYLYKGILAYLLSGPNDLDEYLHKNLTPEQLTTLEFFATWIQQFDRYTSYPIIVSLIVGTYKDLGWSSSDVESAYDKLRDLIASINEAIVLTKCKHREAVKSASLSDNKQVDSQQEPYTLGEIISDIHGYLIYGNSSGAIEELRKHLKDEQVANLVQFKGWLEGQSNYTADTVRTCLNEQAMSIIARTNKLRDNTDIDRLNLAVDIICKTMRGFMSILKVEISTLSGTKSTGGSIAHTLVSDSGLQSSTVVKDTGKLWRGTLDVKEVNRLYVHIADYLSGKPDVDLRLAPATVDEVVCLNAVRVYWGAACKDLGPDIHNYPLLSQLTAMLGLLADGMPDSFKLRDRKHYQEVVHSFGAVISLIKEMTNFINGGDAKPISLPENPLFATLHEKLFPSPIPPEVQYSEEKFS